MRRGGIDWRCYVPVSPNHVALSNTQQPNSFVKPGLPAVAHEFVSKRERRMVGLTRFELVTPRLSSVCSNQLSYRHLMVNAETGAPYSSPDSLYHRTAPISRSDSFKTR